MEEFPQAEIEHSSVSGHSWATSRGQERSRRVRRGQPTEGQVRRCAAAEITSKLVMRVQFLFLLFDRPLSLRDLGL